MSPHNSQHAVIPNSNTPPRIKFSGGRLSILPVLLLLSLLALSPLAAPVRADALTKGDDGVYLIATPADLRAFRDGVNSEELTFADARLTADIDLSTDGTPEEWTPIGDGHRASDNKGARVPSYRGAFDGAGYTVGGYKITKSNYQIDAGFFGYIGAGGTVTGLTVSGKIDIAVDTSSRAGGIAGHNRGAISNCVNAGAVASVAGDTGGIAGVNGGKTDKGDLFPGTISNCVNRGNVTTANAGGGIVGVNGSVGTTSNCVNDGRVSGSVGHVGGIAGKNNGTILNCVNNKIVSDSQYAGGVLGHNTGGSTTSNCVNLGDVYGSQNSKGIGGVMGLNDGGAISNCVSGGNIISGDNAGGVVGKYKGATISNCGWLETSANKGVGSGDVSPAPEPVSLDQTEINESVVVALIADHMNITLRTGDTAKITLNALPGKQAAFGKYVKNITVPPDSEKISAKVNEEKGEITLTSLKEGTSALCVSADLYTTDFNNSLAPSDKPVPLSLTIYVSARRTLGGITLSPDKMNLRVGESGKFTATVTAEGAADQTINWHSSNEKIATVDNEGNVKALAVGEATITAMTADGKHDAAAKVTVANRHSGGNGCAAGVGALALFADQPRNAHAEPL
ncbi:Ig-like domain-containing protein, partial [Cloacibacillus porcorum]